MKLEYSETPRVDMATACRRVLRFLDGFPGLATASQCGDAIWPDHSMTPQGAGGAASRILKRMDRDGFLRWTVKRTRSGIDFWGYELTCQGRDALDALGAQ